MKNHLHFLLSQRKAILFWIFSQLLDMSEHTNRQWCIKQQSKNARTASGWDHESSGYNVLGNKGMQVFYSLLLVPFIHLKKNVLLSNSVFHHCIHYYNPPLSFLIYSNQWVILIFINNCPLELYIAPKALQLLFQTLRSLTSIMICSEFAMKWISSTTSITARSINL